MNTNSTTKKDETATVNPWAPQASGLTFAFDQAKGALGDAYKGDTTAQFNPDQLATFRRMLGFSNSSPIPGQTASAGTDLTGAGVGATTGALSRLGAFSPTGGTSSNIDAANAYADAAASPAAVDAAMRDARRQVTEQTLPGITQNAALTGNNMSSRTAIAEGIVNRGLAEKAADVSANMRAGAFNTGLGLAENSRQFDNNAVLDALKSRGSLGSTAAGQGLDALGNSIGQQGSLFDLANSGGAGLQASDQAKLDNDMGKSNSVWDNLMKYYGIVGSQNWGGTTQSSGTMTKEPSIWETIGGLMSAGGSLAKGFKNG